MLSNELIEFFKIYKNVINNNSINSWVLLYSDIMEDYDSTTLPGEFTRAMFSVGIDPAKIIGEVPRRFLQYQEDIDHYEIPENCTYIGMGAFEYTSITEINIPSTVTGIDFLAFSSTKLKSIKLPDSVKILENAVFHSCKDLEEVDLGSIASIGENCFENCTKLKKVIVPNGILYLHMNNFYECPNLKEIHFKGTKEEFELWVADELEDWCLKYRIICSDGEIKITY